MENAIAIDEGAASRSRRVTVSDEGVSHTVLLVRREFHYIQDVPRFAFRLFGGVAFA